MNTGALMLLSAISVPVLAVAGILGLLVSRKWQVAAVTALAVAIALAVLALTTLALSTLNVQSPVVYFAAVLSVPLLSYAGFHYATARKLQVNPNTQATGFALGLFPLFALGVYFWLLVGCSVAKECL